MAGPGDSLGRSGSSPPGSPPSLSRLLRRLVKQDCASRLHALRQLPVVVGSGACCDGADSDCGGCTGQKVEKELLPAIACICDDADQQMLAAVTEALANMVVARPQCAFAGGVLVLLEILIGSEDRGVRQAAAEAAAAVASTSAQAKTLAVSTLWRAAKSSWGSLRAGGAQMAPLFYSLLTPDEQSEGRRLLSAMAGDEDILVRRATAASLCDYCRHCSAEPDPAPAEPACNGRSRGGALPPTASPEITSPLQDAPLQGALLGAWRVLARDSFDTVRVAAIEATADLCAAVAPTQRRLAVLPVLKEAAADSDWRVRYIAMVHMIDFATVMDPTAARAGAAALSRHQRAMEGSDGGGAEPPAGAAPVPEVEPEADGGGAVPAEDRDAGGSVALNELLPLVLKLSSDAAEQVRCGVAEKISEFASLLPPPAVRSVLPVVERLAADAHDAVRFALAGHVVPLALLLGKELTLSRLRPVLLQLFSDKVPEVRLQLISRLGPLHCVIGVEELRLSVWPAVLRIAGDKNYRLRESVMREVALLARTLGRDAFDGQLLGAIVTALADEALVVRNAAADVIRVLLASFGGSWVVAEVMPRVEELTRQPPGTGKRSRRPAAPPPPGDAADPPSPVPRRPVVIPRTPSGGVSVDAEVPDSPRPERQREGPQPSGLVVWSDRPEGQPGYGYRVRVSAAELLVEVGARARSEERAEKVLPVLLRVASDPVPNVQEALCRALIRWSGGWLEPESDGAEAAPRCDAEIAGVREMIRALEENAKEPSSLPAEVAAALQVSDPM